MEWFIGRICEEFRCVPSVAVREIERDPRLVLDIMELRRYARAKAEVENATEEADASEWAKKWVFTIQQMRQRRRGPKVG